MAETVDIVDQYGITQTVPTGIDGVNPISVNNPNRKSVPAEYRVPAPVFDEPQEPETSPEGQDSLTTPEPEPQPTNPDSTPIPTPETSGDETVADPEPSTED